MLLMSHRKRLSLGYKNLSLSQDSNSNCRNCTYQGNAPPSQFDHQMGLFNTFIDRIRWKSNKRYVKAGGDEMSTGEHRHVAQSHANGMSFYTRYNRHNFEGVSRCMGIAQGRPIAGSPSWPLLFFLLFNTWELLPVIIYEWNSHSFTRKQNCRVEIKRKNSCGKKKKRRNV